MNPLKWAKRQVAKFLDETPKPADVEPSVSHVSEASKTHSPRRLAEIDKALGKRLTHREKMALRGAKWFFISTERFEYIDKKTGEKLVGHKKATYNVGMNAAKRKARGGLSGKSARRRRLARPLIDFRTICAA